MASETENNSANYDEVDRHIRVLSGKLAEMTKAQPAVSGAIDDLEAYFERQVQLRVLQNNTLREDLIEAKGALRNLQRRVQAWACFTFGLVAAYYVAAEPYGALALLSAYWTYVPVAVVACAASKYL